MAALSRIYDHEDYREYLGERMDSDEFGRGTRLRLAQFISTQPSFVSQVLSGRNELSLEHAQKINVFFNHSNEESRYFVNMVLLAKAGTFDLQKFLREQLRDIREQQMQIHKVIVKHELHREDVLYYYGNWACVSAHMLSAVERYQAPGALQAKLGISDAEFKETVNFLTRTGLVEMTKDGKIQAGEAHIHLKKTSPVAQSASVMTRLKVLEKMRLSNSRAVNFSSNFTISRRAYDVLRKRILDFVSKLDEHIQSDEPEEFCTLVLDLIEH